MELFLIWFGLAVIVGVGASRRGRNGFGWFVLSCVISPLLALILLLLLPVLEDPTAALNSRVCPFCAETIKRQALKCKHCGSDLADHPPPVDDGLSKAAREILASKK